MVKVRVIGCGNLHAADDAVGVIAARHLRAELGGIRGLDVVEAGPAMAILDLLDGIDAAVIVDAVRTPNGARPAGEIVRVEAGPEGLLADLAPTLSSHGIGVGEAVALAEALGRAPRIVFVGVEVLWLGDGSELSPPVAASLPALVARVRDEVLALLGPGQGGGREVA